MGDRRSNRAADWRSGGGDRWIPSTPGARPMRYGAYPILLHPPTNWGEGTAWQPTCQLSSASPEPRRAVTLLAGAPGSGKSLLAQSIAAAAVSGRGNVAGIGVEPARVCIVDGENGEDLIQRRFTALGLEAATWGTRLRVFAAEGFD